MKLLIKSFMFIYKPLFLGFLGLNTAVLGLTILVLAFVDPSGNFVHYIGKFWSRMNLAMAFARIRVRGLENISPGRSYILMSNHQSHVDVWALIGYAPLQLRWVMKMELRKVPIFGIACERMGHIYIDRSDSQKARDELAVIRKRFERGSSVVFFPEGTRSPEGALLPFKKGGFVMALQHDVPILPVTINGSRHVLPKDTLDLMPGTIEIVFHPPVAMEGYSLESKELLMDRVRDIIQYGLA